MGLNPWKIKWNQGHPGYWPPKCKNEIRGVQPHMLRKEKIISIISHPTEGFAKIKSRGSRNKIKKVPSQHPKCSRNKTEGVQGQPMCLWNQLKNAHLPFLAAPARYVFGFPSFPITSYNKYCMRPCMAQLRGLKISESCASLLRNKMLRVGLWKAYCNWRQSLCGALLFSSWCQGSSCSCRSLENCTTTKASREIPPLTTLTLKQQKGLAANTAELSMGRLCHSICRVLRSYAI